ncbi:MAG: YdcF family protein [Alphaproteobacteria bacterium]
MGRRLRGAAFGIAVAGLLWLGGLVWFAADIPSAVEDPASPTDAIVVLTGGSVRLKTGLDLLRQGAARTLFVSGVHEGVDLTDLGRSVHDSLDGLEGLITLGHAANDTVGNASETAAWMRNRGFTSLRLVTGSYHIRRSLLEFQHAMPTVRMIPHPVFPRSVKQDEWWLWPGTASLIATEYVKYMLAVGRHRLGDRGNGGMTP